MADSWYRWTGTAAPSSSASTSAGGNGSGSHPPREPLPKLRRAPPPQFKPIRPPRPPPQQASIRAEDFQPNEQNPSVYRVAAPRSAHSASSRPPAVLPTKPKTKPSASSSIGARSKSTNDSNTSQSKSIRPAGAASKLNAASQPAAKSIQPSGSGAASKPKAAPPPKPKASAAKTTPAPPTKPKAKSKSPASGGKPPHTSIGNAALDPQYYEWMNLPANELVSKDMLEYKAFLGSLTPEKKTALKKRRRAARKEVENKHSTPSVIKPEEQDEGRTETKAERKKRNRDTREAEMTRQNEKEVFEEQMRLKRIKKEQQELEQIQEEKARMKAKRDREEEEERIRKEEQQRIEDEKERIRKEEEQQRLAQEKERVRKEEEQKMREKRDREEEERIRKEEEQQRIAAENERVQKEEERIRKQEEEEQRRLQEKERIRRQKKEELRRIAKEQKQKKERNRRIAQEKHMETEEREIRFDRAKTRALEDDKRRPVKAEDKERGRILEEDEAQQQLSFEEETTRFTTNPNLRTVRDANEIIDEQVGNTPSSGGGDDDFMANTANEDNDHRMANADDEREDDTIAIEPSTIDVVDHAMLNIQDQDKPTAPIQSSRSFFQPYMDISMQQNSTPEHTSSRTFKSEDNPHYQAFAFDSRKTSEATRGDDEMSAFQGIDLSRHRTRTASRELSIGVERDTPLRRSVESQIQNGHGGDVAAHGKSVEDNSAVEQTEDGAADADGSSTAQRRAQSTDADRGADRRSDRDASEQQDPNAGQDTSATVDYKKAISHMPHKTADALEELKGIDYLKNHGDKPSDTHSSTQLSLSDDISRISIDSRNSIKWTSGIQIRGETNPLRSMALFSVSSRVSHSYTTAIPPGHKDSIAFSTSCSLALDKIQDVRRISSHCVAVASTSAEQIGQGGSQVSLVFARYPTKDDVDIEEEDLLPLAKHSRPQPIAVPVDLEARPHLNGATAVCPYLPMEDSLSFATGGADGCVYSWSYRDGDARTQRLHALLHRNPVTSIETLPKSDLIISGSRSNIGGGTDLIAFDGRSTSLVASWKSSDTLTHLIRTPHPRILDISFLRTDYDQHRLYDLRQKVSSTKPILSFGWESESLSELKRARYYKNYILQPCPDGILRTWDLRRPSSLLNEVKICEEPLGDVVFDETAAKQGEVGFLVASARSGVFRVKLHQM
ncbi:unnamed protein product [Sympodiomycopsis kandeliae]